MAALFGGPALAAAQPGIAQASLTSELQTLAAHAQTIFVGQIVAIERRNSVVEVTFRIERPVAGATGSTCTLREWAGQWAPGYQRYAVGQRVLAFLQAPSGAGLSSPVHGAEGLVPVVVQGADAPQLLDVRRVAASVVRAPGTPLPTEADGALGLTEVLSLIAPTPSGNSVSPVRLPLPRRGKLPLDMPPATPEARVSATRPETEPARALRSTMEVQ